MDIYEKDAGHYEIHADLPGVEAKDLDITIDNNQIQIKAERRHIHDTDTDTVHVSSSRVVLIDLTTSWDHPCGLSTPLCLLV